MKVQLKLIVQDPSSDVDDKVEGFRIADAPVMLDGPVVDRLAVLDIDRRSGELQAGAPFVPPSRPGAMGAYQLVSTGDDGDALTSAQRTDPTDFSDPYFMQVSVFSTVLKTLQMFEEPDNLGRRIEWAFDGPQLLIVPRAGNKANAKYERGSRSLQFFSFKPRLAQDEARVFTCLSQDIVAHEAAHAIVDGIAPDLFDSATTESVAIHEAIADLVGVIMAFRSDPLTKAVLEETGGSIADATAFSWVAEELGHAKSEGREGYLRTLRNNKTLDPDDTSKDESGARNFVGKSKPHTMSQALSGALYPLMLDIYGGIKEELVEAAEKDDAADSGDAATVEEDVAPRALFLAAERFKRIVLRCLDYLPPGDVTFADYGRALLASDQASYPDHPEEREFVRAEFLRRHLAKSAEQLEVATDFEHDGVASIDLELLRDSEWAAHEFADANRDLFGAPAAVPLRILPRLDVTKRYYRSDAPDEDVRELIVKVGWDVAEPQLHDRPDLLVPVGATVAIDWATKRVRACVISQAAEGGDADEPQRQARAARVDELLADGDVNVATSGSHRTPSGVQIDSTGTSMRVRGTGQLLHAAPELGPSPGPRDTKAQPKPPPGVDYSAFYDLIEARNSPL